MQKIQNKCFEDNCPLYPVLWPVVIETKMKQEILNSSIILNAINLSTVTSVSLPI